MIDYYPREIAIRIQRALGLLPVVVLSGLRQVGKSTMLQNERDVCEGRVYRTLDDFAILAAAKANPQSLVLSDTIFDEVQRCPELLVAIKQKVDEDRRPGRYILSGSANLSLLSHVSETLAGRAAYFTLHPMTRRERKRTTVRPPFLTNFMTSRQVSIESAEPVSDDEVLTGGLPPVCLGISGMAQEWFRGYIQTYVDRDVRQLSQIADLVAFHNLAEMAALRTGQVLSISSLARDIKMNAATCGRYLNLLETSFIVRRLPPFLKNRSSRLIKSPKMLFTDSGLAAFMAGVTNLEAGEDDLLRGALYETYVVQNIAAIMEAYVPNARLAYWHEQGRHEVDLVIEVGRQVFAIEVKAASQWSKNDLSGLKVFLDRTPNCIAGILAYNGKESFQIDDRLWVIPMGKLIE